jgi:hypothetical protein
MRHDVRHLSELDLALLAGRDTGLIRGFSLKRHLRVCEECQQEVNRFEELRSELAQTGMPELNWKVLSAEMRANIHLGLEAGECVRTRSIRSRVKRGLRTDWSLGFAAAFACVLVLVGAGVFLQDSRPRQSPVSRSAMPAAAHSSLESTTSGVELRTGSNSFTLLNRGGAIASQSVNAQGAIGSRSIDSETGSVTINNVYLE